MQLFEFYDFISSGLDIAASLKIASQTSKEPDLQRAPAIFCRSRSRRRKKPHRQTAFASVCQHGHFILTVLSRQLYLVQYPSQLGQHYTVVGYWHSGSFSGRDPAEDVLPVEHTGTAMYHQVELLQL